LRHAAEATIDSACRAQFLFALRCGLVTGGLGLSRCVSENPALIGRFRLP